jgi:tripartite-type tricarboxylate transporter receptor subunit TctC
VATAFALPGTVADWAALPAGVHDIAVQHPQGRIDIHMRLDGDGDGLAVTEASLVRTARKIFDGDLHLPDYVFSAAEPAAGPAPSPSAACRPVTIIVPTPAGGANDAIARAVARRLGPRLGRTVTVDNRSGAHGTIASEYVARAAPDGDTLMLGYIGTHGMHPALERLGYDPVTDFAPVGLIGHSPTILVNAARSPATTVEELIAQAKAQPTCLRYASAGNGTVPHFAAELFALHAGITLRGLTHDGSAAALASTLDGQADLMFVSLSSAHPWLVGGQLRALAVASAHRLADLPDTPTLQEIGVSGVKITQWYALFAPARTPEPVVDRLNAALRQVLTDPDSTRQIADHGVAVRPGAPEELRALVGAELARWKGVVQRAGLTPNHGHVHGLSRNNWT